MGTSLSGLTPATTFDGLLKTSDNDALDTTLKTIGTGDGTDSQLKIATNGTQLANIQFVSGNVITTTSLSTNLRIVSGSIAVNGDYSNPTANTRLHIKGSGATSATTSLLVQNSAGSELFKVQDDGRVDFASLFAIGTNIYGTNSSYRINIASSNEYQTYDSHIFKTYDGAAYSESMRIVGNGASPKVGIGETTPTAKLHLKGSGNDNTTTSLLVQNSDGTELMSLDDVGGVRLGGDGSATTKANIKLDAFSGLFNVTAAKFGNWNGAVYAVFSGLAKTDALFAFGNDVTTASTRMHIKGLGATSATTALLVENSAGTDLLKIEDGGNIVTAGFTFQSNILKPNVNGYIGLDRNNNRTFSIVDSNATRTYLNIQSSSTSNFADVSINTDHLVVKKEGNVAVGTSTLDASAKLQVDSTTQGFLPPRMTTTERDAIATPAAGLMVYNTTTNKAQCYNGTAWQDLF